MVSKEWKNKITSHGVKPASQFLAHDLNARRHPGSQRAAVRGSLNKLGWVAPVIESLRTGKMLDGHARVEEALSKDDQTPIPYVIVDLTEEEERLFLAVYDPIAAMAEYDAEVLSELTAGLVPDDEALQGILDSLNSLYSEDATPTKTAGQGGDEFDTSDVSDGPTRSRGGDLWLIDGKHRILCADSSDASALVKLCDGEAINLCVTSPPYFNQRKEYAEWPSYKDFLDFIQRVIDNIVDNAGDPFILFWNTGDNQEDHIPMIADETVMIKKESGLTYIETLIWLKNIGAGFQTQRNMHIRASNVYYPAMHWEALLVFRRGNNMAKFDPADVEYVTENQGNVWQIDAATNQVEKYGHPAVYPIELPIRAIRCYSTKDALVFDPFMGSGTTLIAASRTGRRCIGIEKAPKFVDMILRRAQAEGLNVELLEREGFSQSEIINYNKDMDDINAQAIKAADPQDDEQTKAQN